MPSNGGSGKRSDLFGLRGRRTTAVDAAGMAAFFRGMPGWAGCCGVGSGHSGVEALPTASRRLRTTQVPPSSAEASSYGSCRWDTGRIDRKDDQWVRTYTGAVRLGGTLLTAPVDDTDNRRCYYEPSEEGASITRQQDHSMRRSTPATFRRRSFVQVSCRHILFIESALLAAHRGMSSFARSHSRASKGVSGFCIWKRQDGNI